MSDSNNLYRGRYLGISERDGWEYATRVNASAVVVVVPVTDDGCLVLVEQFRLPVNAEVVELPAGLVGDQEDPDESILVAAHRELEEETGYVAGKLHKLLSCPSSAGMSDEMVTFILATDLTRTGPGGGDDSEEITVKEVPLDSVSSFLSRRMAEGLQVDPKVYGALHWLERMNAGKQPIAAADSE